MRSYALCRRLSTLPPLLRQLRSLKTTPPAPRYARCNSSDAPGIKLPYYVTTPIFYPNAVPHIGHLYTIVIADIFARYARLKHPGNQAHFLTGIDEHGLKIQKAAEDNSMEPGEFCDAQSQQFRRLAEHANSSHTVFARTSSPEHREAVEHMWQTLTAKGLIYKGKHSGWYSVSDECFYPETQVMKIPLSPAFPARVVSIETGSVVEWAEEENYMFRLSAFRKPLLEYYTNNPDSIFPPQHHSHILSILSVEDRRGSLGDLSVSRPRSRLTWGIQVPGDPDHTIYVWIDALMIYLSGVGYPWKDPAASQSQRWPPNLQIIGKDILRFHALYLPAMLHAAGLPFAQRILSHAHWTVNQKKMSKSVGNVVDPFEVIKEHGIDVVRYYFAKVGGKFRDDADWSDREVKTHRSELASHLGNLLLRLASSKLAKVVALAPQMSLEEVYEAADQEFVYSEILHAQRIIQHEVAEAMEKLEVGDAVQLIMHMLRLTNLLISKTAPWSAYDKPKKAKVCYTVCAESLRLAGVALQPIVPELAERLLDAIGASPHERIWQYTEIGRGSVGILQSVKLFE